MKAFRPSKPIESGPATTREPWERLSDKTDVTGIEEIEYVAGRPSPGWEKAFLTRLAGDPEQLARVERRKTEWQAFVKSGALERLRTDAKRAALTHALRSTRARRMLNRGFDPRSDCMEAYILAHVAWLGSHIGSGVEEVEQERKVVNFGKIHQVSPFISRGSKNEPLRFVARMNLEGTEVQIELDADPHLAGWSVIVANARRQPLVARNFQQDAEGQPVRASMSIAQETLQQGALVGLTGTCRVGRRKFNTTWLSHPDGSVSVDLDSSNASVDGRKARMTCGKHSVTGTFRKSKTPSATGWRATLRLRPGWVQEGIGPGACAQDAAAPMTLEIPDRA